MLKLAPQIPAAAPAPFKDEAEYDAYWNAARERERQKMEAEELALRGIPMKRYAGVAPKPWAGGLLFGPAGVGKTREAIARLLSVRDGIFYEVAEYIEDCRAAEFDRLGEAGERRRRAAHSSAYLILDDLGARRPTQFAEDSVCALVNGRWKAQLETLVTSNLSPAKIAEFWGERIASRVLGFGPIEHMDGPDRRLG